MYIYQAILVIILSHTWFLRKLGNHTKIIQKSSISKLNQTNKCVQRLNKIPKNEANTIRLSKIPKTEEYTISKLPKTEVNTSKTVAQLEPS